MGIVAGEVINKGDPHTPRGNTRDRVHSEAAVKVRCTALRVPVMASEDMGRTGVNHLVITRHNLVSTVVRDCSIKADSL